MSAPISVNEEVVRCKMRSSVGLVEVCLRLSRVRHLAHSQQKPGVSRSGLMRAEAMSAHFTCTLIAQSSQRTRGHLVPDPPKQTSASHLFVLVIFVVAASINNHRGAVGSVEW
uniref:(northern house mosquito) hypothetical protein n=1 Tax=Culex pipiens TaxID=7175 RepID=A0A8D8BK97_CULPI